jgi:hypothetical protein
VSERVMLTINRIGPGVYKIYDRQIYMGAISRSGTRYVFLPEPFVAFDGIHLEQIFLRIKELEYDANPT